MSLEITVRRCQETIDVSICIQQYVYELMQALVDPTLTEVETARIRGQILGLRTVIAALESADYSADNGDYGTND